MLVEFSQINDINNIKETIEMGDYMTTKLVYKIKDINRKIAMFDGKPDRDTVICEEDIQNLKIAMETKAPKEHDPFYYFLYLT